MSNKYVVVISIISGIIDPVKLFIGTDQDEVAEKVAEYFRKCVYGIDKDVSDEEMNDGLDEGYFECGKYEVIINWPDYELV